MVDEEAKGAGAPKSLAERLMLEGRAPLVRKHELRTPRMWSKWRPVFEWMSG